MKLLIVILLLLIPALCFAQASGTLLLGQGAGIAPKYTPMNGDALITNAGAITVSRLGGITPGGACSAGQFVYSISATGQPTCALPTGGSGYPSGAPAQFTGFATTNVSESETLGGGAGSCTYARTGAGAYQLNCPGFAPLASPTFTGTVTMPDASTITSTGYNNVKAIGIGTAASSTANNLVLANTSSTSIFLGSATTPTGSIGAVSGALHLSYGMHNSGSGWVADVASPGLLYLSAGGATFYEDSGKTVGSTYTPTAVAAFAPIGSSSGYGLSVPNNFSTGLAVGDFFVASVGAGNFSIAGGAYYNGSAWIASTTQSAYGLINNIAGVGVGIYATGAGTAGSALPAWTREALFDVGGIGVSHLHNDSSTMAVPSITNGSLMSGSRDTFGYILATAWPVTITWGRAFKGNPGCIANGGAGTSGLFYTNAQSTTSIQIGCVNYAGGGACNPIWFQYMCFDIY